MQLIRVHFLVAVIIAMCLVWVPTAHAGGGSELSTKGNSLRIKAWNQKQNREANTKPASSRRISKPEYTYIPKDEYAKRRDSYQADLQRTIDDNNSVAAARARCTESAGLACNGGQFRNLPASLDVRPAGDPADPPATVVSPQQAAYIAVARLQLTPPQPRIGPPPSINRWKMAAVGYPMWLWADGTLNPAPVADSVYDLTVSLDARLVKVTYAMGDGHAVTCTDNSRRWTRSVAPAAPSPTCGYTYRKPSLPEGDYTVTANAVWAVDWSVNGTTGTLPFYQSASTQLPVGELQVLNR